MPGRTFEIQVPLVLKGVGVHSGEPCEARFAPSSQSAGVRFVRGGTSFLPDVHHLEAAARRATALEAGGQRLGTVEHFLSALCAMGMPAFDIEVDGPELPILDGSAAPVHAALCRAGLRPRFAFVELDQEIEVRAQGGEARLRPVSSEQIPRLTAQVELGPCAPRMESVCFRPTVDDFGLDIAPARTFCHLSEVESLRAQGLIRGGSLDCALVLSEDGPIPGQSYRLPQEPTRHKILDAIGDLSLLGGLPWAEIELFRPGHALIHEVVRQAAPHVRKTQRFADALKTDLG